MTAGPLPPARREAAPRRARRDPRRSRGDHAPGANRRRSTDCGSRTAADHDVARYSRSTPSPSRRFPYDAPDNASGPATRNVPARGTRSEPSCDVNRTIRAASDGVRVDHRPHHQTGRRFVVRYRLGGRAYPIEHGGSFPTMREAKIRRDLVAGELAAGRNPRILSRRSTAATAVRRSRAFADEYQATPLDLADETREELRSHLKRSCRAFGDRDPARSRCSDVQRGSPA